MAIAIDVDCSEPVPVTTRETTSCGRMLSLVVGMDPLVEERRWQSCRGRCVQRWVMLGIPARGRRIIAWKLTLVADFSHPSCLCVRRCPSVRIAVQCNYGYTAPTVLHSHIAIIFQIWRVLWMHAPRGDEQNPLRAKFPVLSHNRVPLRSKNAALLIVRASNSGLGPHHRPGVVGRLCPGISHKMGFPRSNPLNRARDVSGVGRGLSSQRLHMPLEAAPGMRHVGSIWNPCVPEVVLIIWTCPARQRITIPGNIRGGSMVQNAIHWAPRPSPGCLTVHRRPPQELGLLLLGPRRQGTHEDRG